MNYLYAHRGIHDNSKNNVENTIDAFNRAIVLNYGIECDVRLTKDNIPVIIHDKNLLRVTGVNKEINEITFVELKKIKLLNSEEYIPSLSEVLSIVNDKVPLIIEIKKNSISKMNDLFYIVEILDKYNGKYMIESFNPIVLRWIKENRPLYIRGQLSSSLIRGKEYSIIDFLLSNLLLNFLSKPDFIAYDFRFKKNLSFLINKYLYKIYCIGFTIKSEETFNNNINFFDSIIFDSFIP